jgi:hypothetical protein
LFLFRRDIIFDIPTQKTSALHEDETHALLETACSISSLAISVVTLLMMVAVVMLSNLSSLLCGGLDNLSDALTYALASPLSALAPWKSQGVVVKGRLILAAALAGMQIPGG